MTFNAYHGNTYFSYDKIWGEQFQGEHLREVKSDLPNVEKLMERRMTQPHEQTPPPILRDYNTGYVSGNSIFFNFM